MSAFGGTARVIKGEPTATDAARLRRSLTDTQKAELWKTMGALTRDRSGAVLNSAVEEGRP